MGILPPLTSNSDPQPATIDLFPRKRTDELESRTLGQKEVRKRLKCGAPPSNTNALRHGFCSRSFTRAERLGLDSDIKGEFLDELNLARVNANRMAELLKNYKSMSIEQVISASNGLNNYLDRILSLTRAQRFIYQNLTTIEQALEELKDLSPYED